MVLAEVRGLLATNEWCHVAAVVRPNSVKLFFNGALVGTEEAPSDWKPLIEPDRTNYLGRSEWADLRRRGNNPDFDGQLAEIRVWARERTEAQIRENIFRSLTGKEAGLVGLWKFDQVTNGVVKDLSLGEHDGKLIGNARVVSASVPKPSELVRPAVIVGTVSDVSGQPVTGAMITLSRGDTKVQTESDAAGNYRLFFRKLGTPVTITASEGKRTGGLWDQTLAPGEQRIDLRLLPTVALRGEVKALDDMTPLSGVVVQVLKPGAVAQAEPLLWRPDERVVASTATVGVAPPSLEFLLASIKKGRWRTYKVTDGLAGNAAVQSVRVSPDGGVWAATWTGASEFDGNRFRSFTASFGLTQSLVNHVCPLPCGRVWFAHQDGLTLLESNRLSRRGCRAGTSRTPMGGGCCGCSARRECFSSRLGPPHAGLLCSVRQGRGYRRPTVWGGLRLGNGGRDRLLLPMIRDQKERRDGDWEDSESPRHRVHGGGGSEGRSC